MKNLRMLLAAALALSGAGVIRAQTPPPSGLYPSTTAPINGALVDPAGVPLVVIGDNASPSVPKMWFDLGWFLGWTNSTPMPHPLLTTSDPADAGILGAPTTVLLLGQTRFTYGTFNGIRFSSQGWWNADRTIGSEGTTVWSEQRSINSFFTSNGSVPLFRPIFDPTIPGETSVTVASPGLLAGDFLLEMRTRFANGDSNLMFNAYRDDTRSVNILVGYRTIYLREELKIIQDEFVLADGAGFFQGAPLLAGDSLRIQDRIETVNHLYIGQIGLQWERNSGPVDIILTAKYGIGWSHQRIFFDGRTTLEPTGPTVPGGVLVQTSQPYRNQEEHFVVVPNLGARVSVRLARRLRASVSYDLTYASSVARPGNYIDRVVELSQAPSQPQFTGVQGTRPAFRPQDGSFFMHGFTFGLTWAY